MADGVSFEEIREGVHPATANVLRWFEYEHLPPEIAEISRPFCELAYRFAASELGRSESAGPELTVGLRKLLEAKDCIVRAALAV